MKRLLAVFLLCLSNAAHAHDVVYLDCKLPGVGGLDRVMQLSLNEQAGTVIVSTQEPDSTRVERGVFLADKVTFGGFEVSRIDLTIKRTAVKDDFGGRCALSSRERAKF